MYELHHVQQVDTVMARLLQSWYQFSDSPGMC